MANTSSNARKQLLGPGGRRPGVLFGLVMVVINSGLGE
jgi:hypothetical protein